MVQICAKKNETTLELVINKEKVKEPYDIVTKETCPYKDITIRTVTRYSEKLRRLSVSQN